jgi:Fic family protein
MQYTNLSYGGRFKNTDNVIAESNEKGEVVKVLFTPLKPYETPDAIKSLCEGFNNAIEIYNITPLVAIPIFIHDFLCIHPFNDGNGRISRLLTLLALYKSGFLIGRYISIEKIMEQTKPNYYSSLQSASNGWNEDNDNPEAFIKYMLQVLLKAYKELDDRVLTVIEQNMTKAEQVKNVISKLYGKITKKQIMELLPHISEITVKTTLAKLSKEGFIKVVGAGSKAFYIRNDERI